MRGHPIPASSGKVTRHRLNPGGDRLANHALWRIVFTRMRSDPASRRRTRCPAVERSPGQLKLIHEVPVQLGQVRHVQHVAVDVVTVAVAAVGSVVSPMARDVTERTEQDTTIAYPLPIDPSGLSPYWRSRTASSL